MKPEVPLKRCPNCGTLIPITTDKALFPFCSERCKYVDLSKWFKGEYSIATTSDDSDAEDSDLSESELDDYNRD